MLKLLNTFANDESGAVTVDWVVLTAAIVGLGIAIGQTVGGATADLGDTIASTVTGTAIPTY